MGVPLPPSQGLAMSQSLRMSGQFFRHRFRFDDLEGSGVAIPSYVRSILSTEKKINDILDVLSQSLRMSGQFFQKA